MERVTSKQLSAMSEGVKQADRAINAAAILAAVIAILVWWLL